MRNLIYCEVLKLKRSKMFFLSILGVFATPCMMLIEAFQKHIRYPEAIFTLADIYDSSLLYIMVLINLIIYVAITAYLFSREYTENTLKTILPIPVSRMRFLLGKFCILFLWIIMLTCVTWAGILGLSWFYHILIGLDGFSLNVAWNWLLKFLLGGMLMFLTISPFAYITQKSKGIVVPVIVSAVIVMGSAALSNQDLGALYPWSSTYLLVIGRAESSGYPFSLTVGIIILVSVIGFLGTFQYFKKEDIK